MSKKWITAKLPEFVRDVLRDFCLASRELESGFRLLDRSGHVDFALLSHLLGQEMNKGLLWHLKDTAHVLFKHDDRPGARRLGQFLDWSVGYIFHDAMKLREDAYQQQTYAPWFRKMRHQDRNGRGSSIGDDLFGVLDQTNESIQREVNRIRFLLSICRRLFAEYLPLHADNELLARFLFAQNDLVREVFGADYQNLVGRIYGTRPQRMYVLAARSLRRGGWPDEATRALDRAEALAPGCPEAREERQSLAPGPR
ncbi:hypothetical protein [Desulfocurvus sp.]|jgi:hypothetical protein|uniref:hypothetical protein n=1 Tax=Desulfocurvus sp. TaxID=2871698 RepID=UPI0025BBCE8D|nr:hypothetical protein [Desulfocurvus sp.]MCK9238887.1 hypothetical protein [Desulfocurvus sp.]